MLRMYVSLGDGPDLRDCVIASGVISPLINLIKSYLYFQVLITNTVCVFVCACERACMCVCACVVYIMYTYLYSNKAPYSNMGCILRISYGHYRIFAATRIHLLVMTQWLSYYQHLLVYYTMVIERSVYIMPSECMYGYILYVHAYVYR